MTIVEATRPVTGGVDTHLHVHVAATLDSIGGLLGVESFPTTPAGYRKLLGWMGSFGPVERVGVEGTGAYGAGLARYLHRRGVTVIEVDRANRQARRQAGKSDPVDAVEAARAAQSGRARGVAKTRDGNVEAIRALMVTKRSARTVRTKTMLQIRHLCFTGPDELRQRLQPLSAIMLAREAAALRPRAGGDIVAYATKVSVQTLARRVLALDEEIVRIDELLADLVERTAPSLLALYGVGVDSAATLLAAAGDNPERLRSEATWAHLCGVSPIEASSGKVVRHRLNRGGDRQANAALWRIVMVRMNSHPPTRAYVERRSKEGRSKLEIMRMLKRYVAREVYRHLPRA
ncbi:MAG TPA: IS110 family transposase [Mycobacterium sp.]|nr:IS110 family transposase [Mycobacterium sp.]